MGGKLDGGGTSMGLHPSLGYATPSPMGLHPSLVYATPSGLVYAIHLCQICFPPVLL
jgi:hypothetical protein